MSASDKNMDNAPGSAEAAKLWCRVRAARGPSTASVPDSMTIAAYVDGTLDETGRDRVEAWMAAAPENLDLIAAARDGDPAPPPAPASLMARARGLVRTPAVARRAPAGRGPGWLAALVQPGAWAAASAAILLAALVSFEAGREATIHLAAASPLAVDEATEFDFTTEDIL